MDHDELAKDEKDDHDNPLGTLEKYDMSVQHLRIEPKPPTAKQRLVFRLTDDSNGFFIDCAADNEIELNNWFEKLRETTRTFKEKYVVSCDAGLDSLNLDIIFYSFKFVTIPSCIFL